MKNIFRLEKASYLELWTFFLFCLENILLWYLLEILLVRHFFGKDAKESTIILHVQASSDKENIVDSPYLEFQGTLWNTLRYPYLDISDLQNLGKNKSYNHI